MNNDYLIVDPRPLEEFKEILNLPAEEGSDTTLRDLLSTYETEMQINNAVVAQAALTYLVQTLPIQYVESYRRPYFWLLPQSLPDL